MENQENKNQELAITEEQGKLEQEKEAKKTAATLTKDRPVFATLYPIKGSNISLETGKQAYSKPVEIKIPIDPLNKTDKTVDVIINGYRWTIERGKDVKVPRAVKEILSDAQYI